MELSMSKNKIGKQNKIESYDNRNRDPISVKAIQFIIDEMKELKPTEKLAITISYDDNI